MPNAGLFGGMEGGQIITELPRLGSRLIDLEPEQDGCRERNGGQEDLRASVVAGRDAPPILQAPKHDLDPVAALVPTLVIFDRCATGLPARDARRDPFVYQGIAEPVRVISPIGKHPFGFRQAAYQGGSTCVITDLACGHEYPDRPPLGIGNSMQLGVHAALRPPDQSAAPPFFRRRLEAVRCALRYVASIMIVSFSGLSAARPSMIRAKTPMSLHRFQRL